MDCLFEHYVYITITDVSIDIFNKNSNFSSYRLFANYIYNLIKLKKYKEIDSLTIDILKKLKEIYGIDEIESMTYIIYFFQNKKWEIYYEPINMGKKLFNNYGN